MRVVLDFVNPFATNEFLVRWRVCESPSVMLKGIIQSEFVNLFAFINADARGMVLMVLIL